jgi:misacylated tRNA(Ala) deacylase
MSAETRDAFREDAYLQTLEATLLRTEGERGLVFDASNFFASGGGQPGDRGVAEFEDGARVEIVDTVYGEDKRAIVLLAAEGAAPPAPGARATLRLDWERRHRLMRMHTAMHLLTVVCPYPVTGASVGEEESRIDFDLPDMEADKAEITARLTALVEADHPVFTRWITDEELDAHPDLVKSANVKPPRGAGRVRLVCIGEDASVDSQPCGGTHVRSTAEIGPVHIGKIEKKGRSNRRFRLRFGAAPA